MKNWVSLHTHTDYSILDGAGKIDKYISRAVELGMPAIAFTEHGNMFSAFQSYKQCTAAGIKPILGIEAYISPESRFTKAPVYWGAPEQREQDVSARGAYTHLTVLARNATGVRNLYRLHKLASTEGFYYKPRIDLELLSQYSSGLIITTGCAGGGVATRLRLGQKKQAHELAGALGDMIEPGSLFVEVMNHDIDFEAELNDQLRLLSRNLNLPMVMTNDCHYVNPGDTRVHDALCWLQSNGSFKFNGHGFHLRNYDEMLAASPFGSGPLDATLGVADMVEDYSEIFKPRDLRPKSLESYTLSQAVNRGLIEMGLDGDPEYYNRAMYELKTIEDMGYEDYFLVLADIIYYAKRSGIMVGPGRGSAGGSLVAFLLGITAIDPIPFGLLFERFLNPGRISVPDIDTDIQDDRRDELFAYASRKYGYDRVAHTLTLGTIAAPRALQDANRVLGGSFPEGQRLTRMLPPPIFGRQLPLSESRGIRPTNTEVYDLGVELEGLTRNTGKHAAGLVISPVDLDEIIPVKVDKDSEILDTGFTQTELEELGLIKYDLLGLKNLAIIQDTLRRIR